MSVKSLIAMMENHNIAEDLKENELHDIAAGVVRRYQEDRDSMKEWMDCVDEGLKLCKPEFMAKSEPWEGAANYKSTLLTEASNNFGNRATVELMRDTKLVKGTITGIDTLQDVIEKKSGEIVEKEEQIEAISAEIKQLEETGQQLDPEIQQQFEQLKADVAEAKAAIKRKKMDIRDKTQRAGRVTEYMNWQINHSMKDWRKDQKRLMYTLPNIGTMFKKTFYDETLGRPVSQVINYPNFAVNQATVSMEECRSFTHIFALSLSSARALMRADIWRDDDYIPKHIKDSSIDRPDDMTNEANSADNADENQDAYLEQYCWLDLDDDGCEEPYIVTVHKSSNAVVRIVARFDYSGIFVRYGDMRPMPLLDAQRARAREILKDAEEFGLDNPELPDAKDLTGFKIVRIEPIPVITKYGFIPSFDGTFLDMGFFHFLGSATMASNSATNNLLDAGVLANTAMGISAKGFRKRQGDFKFKKGQIMATEVPADQLANSIKMLDFKEPSPTLFQLNEAIKASAAAFVSNVDAGGQIQANTAPTTALTMVQESLLHHTAHMSLIVDAMSEEYAILYVLNSLYLDNDEYRTVVGDEEANYKDDFATDGLSITCGANPEMSSRSQRMMLAEAEISQLPLVIQAGGNGYAILKNWYKAIGSQNVNEYFPNESEMSPQDRAQMNQLRQQQEQANKLQEEQNKLQALQVALLERAENRKDAELEVQRTERLAKADLTLEQVEKTKADTLLSLEKAEAEQVKNQLDIYTTHHQIISKAEASQADA